MNENDLMIKKENILFGLKTENMDDVIDRLSNCLYNNEDVEDIDKFKEAVYKREAEIPTSIGNNVAIPHGKSSVVNNSTVALGVLDSHIIWGEEISDKVKYVFLIAIKDEEEPEKHLRILANLSTNLMNDDFVRGFKNAKNEDELFKAINNFNKEK